MLRYESTLDLTIYEHLNIACLLHLITLPHKYILSTIYCIKLILKAANTNEKIFNYLCKLFFDLNYLKGYLPPLTLKAAKFSDAIKEAIQ